MNNNNLLKISKFLLYLAPLTLIIVYQGSIFPFIVGKYAFFRTIILLALIFFVWGWATTESRKFPVKSKSSHAKSVLDDWKTTIRSPLVIAVSIFVLIFLLAGIFGYNPHASFWSNYERGEGGLQMLSLFIFFGLLVLLFRDMASWRRIFIISLWAGALCIAYGASAALHANGFLGDGFCQRFAGSLGNAAYLGTYMIFAAFYAAYLFVGERKAWKRWFLLALIVLFLFFLFLSQTRGAFLGVSAAIAFGLIYLVFSLPLRNHRLIALGVLIALAILGGLLFTFRHSIDLMPFCGASSNPRILDVSVTTTNFQTRLLLWQQSIKAFKERPLLGWGPENFSIAFEKYFDVRQSTAWFDRAHNIFFDYLVFSGALGLLSFIGIFATLYVRFFKFNRKKNIPEEKNNKKNSSAPSPNQFTFEKALLFSLPIAYLVQGLVLFDVLPIYINIFLFLAFANFKLNELLGEQPVN